MKTMAYAKVPTIPKSYSISNQSLWAAVSVNAKGLFAPKVPADKPWPNT